MASRPPILLPISLGHVLVQVIQLLTCLLDGDGEAIVVCAALCFDRHVPGAITYMQGPCVRREVGAKLIWATVRGSP